ncbi:Rpn family recombination-promoting nuclease/putative transposase [Aetokthonos hydrillicola Thurmond2011]|jgi:predicted transposase/invertase (TIGR01784 family)|uniref:Rpn family recombination-promoting nuclease/putative transposase n=1 Tax=Aetokthonos hydrillicola Thurmond2011 TaxID=2712845 RepID=A0AAP5I9D9_9CYAN|nr:Rpn family recombination-promoting nuclease/putative transposase [Aetokthonos hydrillicola]MBO3460778.1 Rpn family recombination-promoting nuclease/putative transposase [Aetokthonos hydrillicola CCALA 1050]MBW4585375.1 Rpn family recombination-promoting nuclease/putative transposase [Aetokthonos hydrillicola CCALA 1050]MDR9897280.1 Rpn family recombination-promoting nuclease/putative transposase [Aetokthonos hydrillicola Thurmond2011]
MRRDSIFYKLFQQSPILLFELLTNPPSNANAYRFDSVAVKEPKFEIDGVFLPPENEGAGVVYFCEVQFQKDEKLYERVFAESSLYFYRNRDRFSDWEAVIIYPSHSIEQSDIHPHRNQLNGDQVHRIYLDELGDIRSLPIWVALMVLTTVEDEFAPQEARYLLERSAVEANEGVSRAIMEMVTTIMVYKFEQLTRTEVEQMLGITLKETRVYREIKEEGLQEGEQRERSLVVRQLTRRVGELPQDVRSRIETLSLEQLENLGEALLDFQAMADLDVWFSQEGV